MAQFAMVIHGVAALTIPLAPPHRYKMVAAQQTAAYANTLTETSYLRAPRETIQRSKVAIALACAIVPRSNLYFLALQRFQARFQAPGGRPRGDPGSLQARTLGPAKQKNPKFLSPAVVSEPQPKAQGGPTDEILWLCRMKLNHSARSICLAKASGEVSGDTPRTAHAQPTHSQRTTHA